MMAFNDDAGDQVVMDAFFRKHGRYLYTYARQKVGDRTVAEDVVCESIRRVLERYDKLRGFSEEDLLRYMLRTVANGCVDHYRAACRECVNEEWIHNLQQSEVADGPQQKLETELERRVIAHCASMLPEHYRTVLELRVLQEMEYTDIAAAMQISEANARMMLTRAKRQLMKLYRKQEEAWNDREQKCEL